MRALRIPRYTGGPIGAKVSPEDGDLNNMAKNMLLWLAIAAVLLSVFNNFNTQGQKEQLGYSAFIQEVQNNRLSKVVVDGLTISAERTDGSSFETIRPMVEDPKLMDDLLAHNVVVEGKQPEQQSVWTQLLVASFPILLILAVFMFFMRQMQGGGGGRGGPMSFGKSKAKLLGEDQITTTFADVAGVDEAKEDVQELVEFLRDPSRFQKLGGRIPRGVLMVGQPGTGKTKTVLRIAKMVEEKFSIGGFTTHPIEEDGEIVGYNLKDFITKEEELSASVRWDVKPKVPGRNPESTPLGIRLDAVNRIATASVQKAIEESDLILVDEVGKLVSESKEFSAVLKEALKCGKPMLITMHKRSRNPLLQSIRKRDDLRTLEVTPINSAILPSKAVNILKTGMV